MKEFKWANILPEEGEISNVKIVTTDLDIVEVSSYDYKGDYAIKYVSLRVTPGPEFEDDVTARVSFKTKKEALLLRNALDMMIKETWD